jgi:Putative DNA-binding domain
MISKPLDQIAPEDITELCTRGVYENQVVEFKQELPGERGRSDPWNAGGDFTNYARDRLFREIVAFANAQGGTLILGIEETEDNPPRAAAVRPIPRVHDLAIRLEEAARACIDPRLPALQARGIEMDDAGGGVLIFRVTPSPVGPHRVDGDGHAFIRRGATSMKMTMREIQDLTLNLARGVELLDAVFTGRATAFAHWLQHSLPGEGGGVRITAVPLAPLPRIQRIAGNLQTPEIPPCYVAKEGDRATDLLVPRHGFDRPIVRGLRRNAHDDSTRVDILESGLVDLWHHNPLTQRLHLHLTWFLGAYLSVLDYVDWMRSVADAPDWEFAIELGFDVRALSGPRLVLGEIHIPGSTIEIADVPITFPRIPSRNRSDREDIINLVVRDLLDAAGDQSAWPRLVLTD